MFIVGENDIDWIRFDGRDKLTIIVDLSRGGDLGNRELLQMIKHRTVENIHRDAFGAGWKVDMRQQPYVCKPGPTFRDALTNAIGAVRLRPFALPALPKLAPLPLPTLTLPKLG